MVLLNHWNYPFFPVPVLARGIRAVTQWVYGIIANYDENGFKFIMHIAEFSKGDKLRLIGFGQTERLYKRRLLAMGLTSGAEITVLRFAPLGCPVEIEIRSTHLSLRKEEAAALIWERI